jgi:hypothetical protein
MILSMYLIMLITPSPNMSTVEGAWITGMLMGGFREEVLKFLFYIAPFFVGRMRSGGQVMYLAFLAGLTFGVIENANYCIGGLTHISQMSDVPVEQTIRSVILARLFNTAFLHSCLTFMGSIFIVYSYTGIVKRVPRWLMFIIAPLVPSVFHGLYDVALMLPIAKVSGTTFWADVVNLTYGLITLCMVVPLISRIRSSEVSLGTLAI